jgi:cytochrome c oxidase subunit I
MFGALADPLAVSGTRRLAAGWMLLAVLALGLSTACALLLVFGRIPLPGGALASAALFRSALVLHVGLAVVVWFLSCAAAMWTLAAGRQRPADLADRAGLAAAGGGVAAMVGALFSAQPDPVLANYVPVLDQPLFLYGLICFLGAVAWSGARAAAGLWQRCRSWCSLSVRRAELPAPWRLAAALSLAAAMTAAVALGASLRALGKPVDAAGFELLAWGPGHVLQFVHVLLLMAAWTVLGEHAAGKPVASRTWLCGLIAAAALPLLAVPVIYLSFPVDSVPFRHAFTRLMAWGSWPAAALLGARVAWQLLAARNALTQRHAAAAWPLLLSVLLFLLGCVFGASIRGESTMVPAHYHGTIGAVTLAYMALGYRFLAAFGLSAGDGRMVRWQPLVYGCGLVLLASGLAWSGWLGVPRKTLHVDVIVQYPAYFVAMCVAGIGGFLAVSGAALFVLNVARALRTLAAGRNARIGRSVMTAAACMAIAGGLLSACLPAGGDAASDPARHAQQKRKEEIDRRFAQAATLLREQQYVAAGEALQRVLELAPSMPEAHVNMGFALIGMDHHAAARDAFQRAIDLRTTQINAYYGLALALEGTGDLAGALGAMRSYVHLSKPDDPFLRKANAAVWEWETQLQRARGETDGSRQAPPQISAATEHGAERGGVLPESGNGVVSYPIREKKLN